MAERKIFIPTDRVGVGSFQKSISRTTAVVNQLIKNGETVQWHMGGLTFEQTSRWPEGHYYQCGYSMDDREDLRTCLDQQEILYEWTEAIPEPDGDTICLKPASIALYNGAGAGPEFSAPLVEVLEWGGFEYTLISDEEIREGKLMAYDIFLVPGSPDAGECYYVGLGELGHEKIREFLRTKGQYMGICGGAYFPLSSYDKVNPYWLNVVEATEDEDLDFWHKGSGLVSCRIDEPKHPLFAGVAAGKLSTVYITYWEGPAIHIVGDGIRQLGHFERLIASGSARRPGWDFKDNNMPREAALEYYNPISQELFDRCVKDRTSFAEADYYGHKILMISPHRRWATSEWLPEKTVLTSR